MSANAGSVNPDAVRLMEGVLTDSPVTVESYAEDYSFEADEGSITPTENERAMLIDFGHGLLWEMQAAGECDPGWQPIASAPKDGKSIIVGWPGYVSETAMWDIGTDQWVKAEWQRGPVEHTPTPFEAEPTHWQPLPPAPEVQS